MDWVGGLDLVIGQLKLKDFKIMSMFELKLSKHAVKNLMKQGSSCHTEHIVKRFPFNAN
jgi:hypothetical protein